MVIVVIINRIERLIRYDICYWSERMLFKEKRQTTSTGHFWAMAHFKTQDISSKVNKETDRL